MDMSLIFFTYECWKNFITNKKINNTKCQYYILTLYIKMYKLFLFLMVVFYHKDTCSLTDRNIYCSYSFPKNNINNH